MDLSGRQVDDTTVEIRLSIAFGEQEYRLNWPRLTFAVQGGEVRLQLEGAAFHHADDAPGQMHLVVNKKVVMQSGTEASLNRKQVTKLGGKIFNPPQSTAHWEGEIVSGHKDTRGLSEELGYSVSQVQPLLSPRPGWRFTNRTNGAFLEGTLINQLGGTCTLTGGSVCITATFHIRDRDVVMRAAEVFDFNPMASSLMKIKLARRLIFNRLLKPKCYPYLSRVAVRHG